MTIDPDLLPVLLGLAAAFCFALGALMQSRGLAGVDARSGAAISIATSAGIYWLAAPVMLDPAGFLMPAVLVFALIGVFRPALSGTLAVTGINFLGPTLSTTLSSTGPLFGTVLGVLWLGEVLHWQTALGTAGIMAAIVLLAKGGKGLPRDWPMWALALPVMAAAIRSLAHVLAKLGMATVPDPYFAALVGFSVSAAITFSANRMRRTRPVLSLGQPGVRWFIGGGTCYAVAAMALNTALLHGDVVIIVPLVAASPVFTLLMSWLLFRRERLTGRTVAAVSLVVPSVILIALSR